MARTVCVLLDASDAARLFAIVSDRSRPLEHRHRARIVLHSGVQNVARRAGVGHPAVWRWRRHADAGSEGLLRDRARP